ncbi:hypothetical protein BMJ31_10870, partial [Sinorhizobium medicae]
IIEAEIHLAKRPKLFRQTEPALPSQRLVRGQIARTAQPRTDHQIRPVTVRDLAESLSAT